MLRAEIQDGGSFGASMELSDSASVPTVSSGTKAMEFVKMAPLIGV